MSKRNPRIHVVYSQYPGEKRAISGTFKNKADALRYARALEQAPPEHRPYGRFSYGGAQPLLQTGAKITPSAYRFYEKGFRKSLRRGLYTPSGRHALKLERLTRKYKKTHARRSR